MRNWGEKRDLSPAQQHMFMLASPIVVGQGKVHGGNLNWQFDVQPTVLSRTYKINLDYDRGGIPNVFVRTPDLRILADGRPLPHIYHNPDRLCLYMPGTGQWDPTKRLDKTIVPWTFMWLFYFEEWLSSGEWKGGGIHPGDVTDLPAKNRHQRRLRRRL